MKSIQIQLTNKCNERCFMCKKYTWENKEIDTKILKEKIQKYKECTFSFSGGDPLAYSKIKELNEELKKHKIVYQIFTNMNYKLNDEMQEFLNNAKFIQVSLDGSNSIVYESVRRSLENGFECVLENILKFKNKIKVNCTVSSRNYFDIKNIYDLCNDLNLVVRFFPVHTSKVAMLDDAMLKDIKNQFKNNVPDIIYNNLFINNNKFDKCYVKKEHRVIDVQGIEYPCCRAINDNGYSWGDKNSIDNLNNINDENVLYNFCNACDRYVKFNKNWNKIADKKELFL